MSCNIRSRAMSVRIRAKPSIILLAAIAAAISLHSSPVKSQQPSKILEQEAYEIAREAYIYAYPLVIMDVTRQQLTNFEAPPGTPGQGPPNQFIHIREF